MHFLRKLLLELLLFVKVERQTYKSVVWLKHLNSTLTCGDASKKILQAIADPLSKCASLVSVKLCAYNDNGFVELHDDVNKFGSNWQFAVHFLLPLGEKGSNLPSLHFLGRS